MPKTMNADALRQKALEIISGASGAIPSMDVQIAIYGDTNDTDEHRRRAQRIRHALINLIGSKHIVKAGRGLYKLNNGRPEPQVHDLPTATKRKYTRHAHANGNGAANGDLKGYLIRDIRAKLSELEALLQ